jgi:hypothetical protein
VIRITGAAAADTACARGLLADSLRQRAAMAAGDPYSMYLTAAAAWPQPALAAACHQLREIIFDTAAVMELDPMHITTGSAVTAPDQWFAYYTGHQFLARMGPWLDGGMEICCEGCLLALISALAGTASWLTGLCFNGDYGDAEDYVRAGKPLPGPDVLA